jgi:hypothetical protein
MAVDRCGDRLGRIDDAHRGDRDGLHRGQLTGERAVERACQFGGHRCGRGEHDGVGHGGGGETVVDDPSLIGLFQGCDLGAGPQVGVG